MQVAVSAPKRALLGRCDAPNAVQHLPALVLNGATQWQDVVLHCDAGRCRDGSVDAERLAHNSVEVRQRVELVHRRVISADGEELVAQLRLRADILREGE